VTDLPSTVRDRLLALLGDASDAARERRATEVRANLDAVERLAGEMVKDERLSGWLHHGCDAVDRLVDDEPLVAAEYLDAMWRRVETAD
jgi:hypothetical protein